MIFCIYLYKVHHWWLQQKKWRTLFNINNKEGKKKTLQTTASKGRSEHPPKHEITTCFRCTSLPGSASSCMFLLNQGRRHIFGLPNGWTCRFPPSYWENTPRVPNPELLFGITTTRVPACLRRKVTLGTKSGFDENHCWWREFENLHMTYHWLL